MAVLGLCAGTVLCCAVLCRLPLCPVMLGGVKLHCCEALRFYDLSLSFVAFLFLFRLFRESKQESIA